MIRGVLRTIVLTGLFLALTAPVALAAEGHDGGEGWWGETNDKVITNAGFVILTLIQSALDRRKDRRLAAARARKERADLRGGW